MKSRSAIAVDVDGINVHVAAESVAELKKS
jgi:hypothetical protein